MSVNGAGWGAVRSTDASFKYWKDLAGYKGQPVETAMPDKDSSNAESITRYVYKAKAKPELALFRINKGGHSFPRDLDMMLESWAFFKREIKRLDSKPGK